MPVNITRNLKSIRPNFACTSRRCCTFFWLLERKLAGPTGKRYNCYIILDLRGLLVLTSSQPRKTKKWSSTKEGFSYRISRLYYFRKCLSQMKGRNFEHEYATNAMPIRCLSTMLSVKYRYSHSFFATRNGIKTVVRTNDNKELYNFKYRLFSQERVCQE